MAPAIYHDLFTACASVAGALIGLLFVAISVSPARLTGEPASTTHRVMAATAFSALVNALVIALVGLLPGGGPARTRHAIGRATGDPGRADDAAG